MSALGNRRVADIVECGGRGAGIEWVPALVREDIWLEFFSSDRGSLPKLRRLSWQRRFFGRLRGRRYSDNFGCVARKRASA
jgi:hypothetical protein